MQVIHEHPVPAATALRAQLSKERREHDRLAEKFRNQIRRERAKRVTVDPVAETKLAILTISKLVGVPPRVALNGARGESGFRPSATNGQFCGPFQLGRNFYPGPYIQTCTDARHPWLAAAAALSVARVQGDRQWEVDWRTGTRKPNYPANSKGWRP